MPVLYESRCTPCTRVHLRNAVSTKANFAGLGRCLSRRRRYRLAAPTLHYAYHPLFGQVLRRRQIAREPEACRRLISRAAAAFAERDEPLIALDCYLKAGEFPAAARLLLEIIHAEAHPPIRTVLTWLPRFPTGMRRKDQMLLVAQSYLQFRSENPAEAVRLCARARLPAHRQEPAARAQVLLAVARLLRYERQDLEAAEAVLCPSWSRCCPPPGR